MSTRVRKRRWTSAAARRILGQSESATTVEEAVYATASRLLEGVSCPPTDLDVLKERLNVVALEPMARLPISGALRKREDGLVVIYSSSLTPARRRFTIAHELGHAVFEGTGPNGPRYGRELERICDLLAAEFLMPRDVFVVRAGETVGSGQVLGLARQFGTSVMATALRCQQLLGVSAFQVEEARVVWGYGAIRRDRDLQADAHGFGEAITRAMRGDVGEGIVLVNGRRAMLQWVPLGENRALFVLRRRGGRSLRQGDSVGHVRALD